MDAGIVPDGTMSSISADSYRRNPEWLFGIHSSTTLPMLPNLAPMNREAKVQRYREKRKARKFEKKIRYASRQAYAETRPRVKGKFAREIDKESELDQMFSMDEYPHGIGPSS
ncbi:hypothetical protein Vadar_001671 [Vaccinium darrowii]|uniref:Uncharacterized protein n=1 Tax=Vaccinium darrowii TaxID=229202 RepID=A0ACB7YU80_9ERIC|nr:hypothetical protein Vadar_001671 [Vaccinium darrowii]